MKKHNPENAYSLNGESREIIKKLHISGVFPNWPFDSPKVKTILSENDEWTPKLNSETKAYIKREIPRADPRQVELCLENSLAFFAYNRINEWKKKLPIVEKFKRELTKLIRQYEGKLRLLEKEPIVNVEPVKKEYQKVISALRELKGKVKERFPETIPEIGIQYGVKKDLSRQAVWNKAIFNLNRYFKTNELTKSPSETYKVISKILNLQFSYPNDHDLVRQRLSQFLKNEKLS